MRLVLAACAVLLAACSSTPAGAPTPSGSGPRVVAAFYPLAYAAEQVAGDAARVELLTPPGVEPHDLELSAAQVAQIAEADLVLYVPGFQPAVDEAVAQQAADRAVDVTRGLATLSGAHEDGADHGGEAVDPHVWLDPANMALIGQTVADRLGALAPQDAPRFAQGASALAGRMQALTDEYGQSLANCRTRKLVVSHEAFAYLAKAFGLEQVGISGLSPDAEPSPARLREVADLVRANGVTTIYSETLVDPRVAETIAGETGASVAVLDPLEGLQPDSTESYETVMQRNLSTLVDGQGCS
jgi:zinc transport system substrate-binding protein